MNRQTLRINALHRRIVHYFSSAFWRGFFSVFGSVGYIFPQPRRRFQKPLSPEEAFRKDREALLGDMRKVGDDMRRVLQGVGDVARRQSKNTKNVIPLRRKRT